MQFLTLAATVVFASMAAAQSGTCFDDGDCFFQGGHCVKSSGAITGSCASSISSAPGSTPTSGSTCFDDGDCIWPNGGTCVKSSGAITGYCSAAAASSGFPFTA